MKYESRNGAAAAVPSGNDGNIPADDGKPKDKVRTPWKHGGGRILPERCVDDQQVFRLFLRGKGATRWTSPKKKVMRWDASERRPAAGGTRSTGERRGAHRKDSHEVYQKE